MKDKVPSSYVGARAAQLNRQMPGGIMKVAKKIIFAASLTLASALSHSAAWECKPDVEVQCTAKSCSVSPDQGVIPIGLSFDSHGTFSLCAYSGCWEGKGRVVSASPFLVISAEKVSWSDPNRRVEGREDVLIAFSPRDRIAMVKAGSLSLPMRCSQSSQATDGP